MKQTASSLRIDLAQFRELAAFMQFSSDLDLAARKQLDRGERLTEILKQHQYAPIDVYKQVMILKAGISGRLDKYATVKLLTYQKDLFYYLDGEGEWFLKKLKDTGSFTEELENETDKFFDAFENQFHPESRGNDIDSGYTANMAVAFSRQNKRINRNMLKLVERITSRELASPSLEKELEEIISGDGEKEKDRFNDLIETSQVLDYKKSKEMEALFKTAAKYLSREGGGLGSGEIFKKLMDREKSSSTALTAFFALPHAVVEGKGKFQMLIVRSHEGVRFSASAPETHAIFFLIGSIDQQHFHLVVISTLAQIVNHPEFEEKWMKADSPEAIKELLLRLKKQVKQQD